MDADLDAAPRARAAAQGIAVWALLGLLLGGLGPGVAILMMPNGAEFAGFVIASESVGLVTGVLVGILDHPRRLPGPVWLDLTLSAICAAPIGALWAGLTGAAGGAGFMAVPILQELLSATPGGFGPDVVEIFTVATMIGAMLGVIVGTPPVVLFSVVRSLTLAKKLPWWLAHVGAVVLIALLSVPGFMLLLGSV